MVKKLTCLFFACVCMLSCTWIDISRRLDRSEKLLAGNSPQEGLLLLEEIDASQIYTMSQRARYSLLLSMAYDKNYIDVASDSLIRIAREYYKSRHRNHRYRMLSYYYSGIVSRNQQSNIPAILYLERAEQEAQEMNDLFYLGLINRNKSGIMTQMNNSRESIAYLRQAIHYFEEANADAYALYAKASLSIAYVNERNYSLAKPLMDSLIQCAPEPVFLSKIKLAYCKMLTEQGNNWDEALKVYNSIDPRYYSSTNMAYKAYVQANLSQKDSAGISFQTAYRTAVDEADSALVDALRSRIAFDQGDYIEAYHLLDNAAAVQDSLTRQTLNLSANIAQRDFFKEESHLRALEARSARQKSWLVVCILFLVAGLVVLLSIIKTRQKDAVLKEQMSQLAYERSQVHILLEEKADILGALFSEKVGHLDTMAEEYFMTSSQETRDRIFREYKKKRLSLQNDEDLYKSLESALDKYCNGIMSKLRQEIPDIKGNTLKSIMLFFAGIPNITVQLITGKISLKSVEMERSRCRHIIRESNAPDTDFFMQMLKSRKTATRKNET